MIKRRELLVKSAAVVLGATNGLRAEEKVASAAKVAPPALFGLGVCEWTLNERTADPASLSLAASLGLDALEWDAGHPTAQAPERLPLSQPELLASFLEKKAQHPSVATPSLALGALNDIPYKSVKHTEAWLYDIIPSAQKLGIEVILVPFFGKGDLRGDEAGKREVIARLKRFAPTAEKSGISFGLESWLKADEIRSIIDEVASPAIRVYYDVGNLIKVGAPIHDEMRQLRTMINRIHLKDNHQLYGRPGGDMDFPAVRKTLDEIGYRGWLMIEGTAEPLGKEKSTAANLAYLRTIFPRS
jgi:L-ribulose-5-phosphate 3-epimerase